MSINVDDHGDQHPPDLPLRAHLAADWVDIADAIDRHHPDVAAEHATDTETETLTRFGPTATSSCVHPAYLAALREGDTRTRYRIPTNGTVVSIALTTPAPSGPPYDTCRERESWLQLRQVVADIHAAGDTTVLHPDLPHELAIAVWDTGGHRVYVARPGTPSATIRAARPRARWHTITSLPLVAAVTDRLGHLTATGQATMAATAAASALIVPTPVTALPPRDSAPIEAADLFTRDQHIHPDQPLILTPASTSPALLNDAEPQDIEPGTGSSATDSTAGPTAGPNTTSAAPESPAPTRSADPTSTRGPSITERATAPPAADPVPEAPPVPKSAPAEPPTPAPTSAGPPRPRVTTETRPARGKRLEHEPGHGPKRGHPNGKPR